MKCDSVMCEDNEDKDKDVICRVKPPVERALASILKFILCGLPSILSSADRNCYTDLVQSGGQP